ncbi:MAG: hypothetical protein ACP5UI_01175 [Thermoprotei archaeon]|nr:hypothetical protein [TACK group archaeon]
MNARNALKKLLVTDPCMKVALARGYANASEIARRAVSLSEGDLSQYAVLSALKRMSFGPVDQRVLGMVASSTIDIRTGLAKLSIRSEDFEEGMLQEQGGFMTITKGLDTTTFLLEEKQVEIIVRTMRGGVLERKDSLAAMIIRGPLDTLNTPGYLAFFAELLASSSVNVEDIASSYYDVMFVLSEDQIPQAFSLVNEAIDSLGHQLGARNRSTS